MENTLLIRTEASYSLNFLIYLQNIYLNQTQSSDQLKYPYILTKCEFRKDFEKSFKELWDLVSQRISEHPMHDQTIFFEEKLLFYKSLFVEHDDCLHKFTTIYLSYKVWWGSFAGRFAIETSFDAHGQDIYTELNNLLLEKRRKPQKELNISLIYDACILLDIEPASYFAVLPIRDWFVHYKELSTKLLLSID
jgi:L-rhamnose mutarotase